MGDIGTSGTGWETERVSRRKFIAGAAAVVAVGAGTAFAVESLGSSPGSEEGLVPLCMAMHVHASASEGSGSMQAQLVQAVNADVDVLWWTEHDHRMSAHAAPTLITFSGLTEEPPDAAPWTWQASRNGAAVGASHIFCTAASHPEIGDRATALRMSVQARAAKVATHALSGQAENLLNRTSLAGLSIVIDVRPSSVSPSAHAAVNVVTSYRPQNRTQPPGLYTLSYRIGGASLPGVSTVVAGNTALIEQKAPADQWTTITLVPELDLARLWPGVDGRDSSLFEFSLSVGAHDRSTATAYFSSLRFERLDDEGNTPLDTQAELMRRYAPEFPTVRQIQALEVSLTTPHLGWYGGKLRIPDHTGMGPLPSADPKVAAAAVHAIHQSGGLASYCHPFGTSISLSPPAEAEAARVAKSTELIANRALGCDLIEVGYRRRGGCNLAQHESLWDNCSRNAILLTGIGVSDDHAGENWVNGKLNFATWAWARNATDDALLAALRRGRVYFGDLARFRGALDIRIGRRSAMGTASVSHAERRTLSILASGLPTGGSIDLIRGTVDFAGPADTDPQLSRATFTAADFGSGDELSVIIDTTAPRFVRLVVKDQTNLPVGLSNPVWLLREDPKFPVPYYRKLTSRA